MADKKQIEWEIRLKDLASKILREFGTNAKKEAKKADSAFSKLGKSLGGMVGAFGKIAAGVGVAAVAFKAFNAVTSRLSRGVEDAIAFSRAMAEVSTISEDVAARLGAVTDQVLDLSTKFGLLETDAAKALYQTISAGVTDTTKAMGLLDGAVTLSRGGLADLTSTIDLLTNTINAYGMSVDDVEHINNVFFETVRLGKTTITNLADSMGVATPIAASLGVSVEELSAMLAALTKGGVDTTTAVIYVRQALNSILKPSTEAQELMKLNSISFDAATVKAHGFVGILNELKVKLGDNIESWQKFFPNVRAFIPVLALAGNQFEEFQTILGRLTSAALDEAQPAMRALERVMLSAGEKITVLRNAARQGFMQLGLSIIEGITGPIDSIDKLQAGALNLREAIAGLEPALKALTGTLALMASTLPMMVALMIDLAEALKLPGFEEGNRHLERAADRMEMVSRAGMDMGMALLSGGEMSSDAFQMIVEDQENFRLNTIENIRVLQEEQAFIQEHAHSFERLQRAVKDYSAERKAGAQYGFGQTGGMSRAMSDELRNFLASLREMELGTFAMFAGLDDKIVAELEQAFVDAGIESRKLSDLALDISDELIIKLVDPLVAGELSKKYDQALRGEIPGLKEALEDFQIETGREFTNVRDALLAEMSPARFTEALAASVGSAPYAISSIIEDASTGVIASTGKSLQSIFDSMGDSGVAWAKDLYLQLEGEFDLIASQAVLGPQALRQLEKNVHKAQKELLKLAGPELQQQLEQDVERTLGMGALETAESAAAAQRKAELDAVALSVREYGIALEELKYRADDSAQAQIAAIELTTASLQAGLKERLLSTDEAVHITQEEYEALYTALEEGEKRQIELVKQRSLQESQAAAKALADERRRLEAFRERAREEQMAALMQPFEDVEAFVTVTPGMQLESLMTALDAAEQRLTELKDLNLKSVLVGDEPLVSEEQLASLQALIDNVKEYEMVAAEAEVQQQKMKERFEELPEGIQGAALALGDFIKRNLDLKQVMGDFVNNFLQGFGDLLTDTFTAIATGAKSASEAWSDFGRMFVTMIVQMASQLAIMLTLAAALKAIAPALADLLFGAGALNFAGLKDGGIVQGGTGEMHALANGGVVLGGLGRATPVRGYANGGPIVSGPHVALIGEGKHNEAVVPLPDGRSIPVDMRGGGDAGQNINVNINAVDAKGIDQLLVDRSSTLRDIIRQALNEDRLFRNQVASVR